jgi:MFS family permease
MPMDALRQILGNRSILRVELGWLVAIAAEWAYLVAALVYAYDVGGVAAVGLASTLRMLPAAFIGPLMTAISDRFSPGPVLVGTHVGQGVLVGLVGLGIVVGASPVLVLTAILLEGIIATLERPTTMAALPALARSPQELVASNAAISSGEAVGTLLGPTIGGILIGVAGPGPTVIATAGAFGVAGLLVLRLEVRRPVDPDHGATDRSAVRELLAGFGALRSHAPAGLLVALFSAQTFVRGVLTVLIVAVSVELLGLGQSGVGYLTSAIGAGGLVGAILAFGLVGRRNLASVVSLALAAWGLPILLLGLAPVPLLAFGFMATIGVANATLDVSGLSLLQRIVPNRVRGRLFGAFESIVTLTMGIGSLVAPLVVAAVGLTNALIVAGAILPVLALMTASSVRRTDAAAVVPQRQLDLLRGIPMFSPLTMSTIERIAGGLIEEQHEAGVVVIRQGDAGDSWYLVVDGTLDVVYDGRPVSRLGTGAGFGEIALLHDRPRTATVRTATAATLYRLPRGVFLEAVTGNPHAIQAGENLVRERLAAQGH